MTEVYATPRDGGAASPSTALSVRQVEKVFGGKGVRTKALDGITLSVDKGEFTAVMGPSGSGKTTLLNCISTIERPTSGSILVGGCDITRLRGRELARFRRDELGFIFQDSNLLDTLTGFENIALALTIKGEKAAGIEQQINDMALALGVHGVLDKFPGQMSGGQRQRIAAARAMVTHPKLILADEPTGALDSRNATIMLDTLTSLNLKMGATIIMVTHDAYAASFTKRVLFIKDGSLFTEVRRGEEDDRAAFFNRIMEVQAFLGGEAGHAC